MKGKKLIELFDTLNKSNKHTLLNKCKVSNDKRYKELYKLLITHNGSKKQFQEKLNQTGLALTKNNNVNIDKAIRRFVDFAVTVIEDVLIHEHINKDKPLRNSILSNIFQDQNNVSLQSFYLRKLNPLKIKDLKDEYQEQYYDQSIFLSSRSQKQQDYVQWWGFIAEKYELTNKICLNKLTDMYELASSTYLVNKQYGKELLDKMMQHKHLKLVKDVVKGNAQSIEIKMAEVRFNFEKPNIAFDIMDEVREDAKNMILSEGDRDYISRKINFLSFLLEFNYNQSLSKIKEYNNALLDLTTKYNRPDSVNKFYNMLIRITEGKIVDIDEEIDSIREDFILHDDEYLLNFLFSLYAFVNGDYRNALLYINELSYAPNLYVRIWSKQIELITHYKKGNIDLCETLTDRVLREIKKVKTMPYTLASSAQFLIDVHGKLGVKSPELYKELSSNFVSYSLIHDVLKKHL